MNEEKGEPMIVIEDGCGVHRNTQISARNLIHIERDVIMGPAASGHRAVVPGSELRTPALIGVNPFLRVPCDPSVSVVRKCD